jgi:hypothetical protein
MKHILPIFLIAAGAVTLASCNKSRDEVLATTGTSGQSFIKIVHAYTALTPSTATPAAGPSVNIFVNNAKINAAPIDFASIFPIPSGYAAVPAGLNQSIKVVLNRTGGSLPSDTISSYLYNLSEGGYMTIFLADTLPNPTPQSPILLPFGETVSGARREFYKMRFVNLIPSTDTLEVFSKALNTTLMAGTRFKFASDWIELPLLRRNDTLQLRKVGTTTVITDIKTWNPSTERVYTVFARGSATGTGTRVRTLTSYLNR